MLNRWVSHDAAEPPVEWSLSVPDEGPASRRALLEDVLGLGSTTGAFAVRAVDLPSQGIALARSRDAWAWLRRYDESPLPEILPFGPALLEGEGSVEIETRVVVRRSAGELVEEASADAGALLRSLEADLDPLFARRFAAQHPFVGVWSETGEGRAVVHLGFWTDLFWVRDDPALYEANAPRLWRLRDGVRALALARRGEASVPVPSRD